MTDFKRVLRAEEMLIQEALSKSLVEVESGSASTYGLSARPPLFEVQDDQVLEEADLEVPPARSRRT